MSHPIIDFDVKGNCDMILETAKDPPDNRWKKIIAVVRGMGSGKTRCLEEIRRELLKRPGVLPIAITFNAGNGIIADELTWGGDCDTSFALMVIARCASALYDVDIGKMLQLMYRNLQHFDIPHVESAGYHLVDMFLRYVVYNERQRGKLIEDVVIIVDEVVKAVTMLKEVYKYSVQSSAILREALLNEKVEPFEFNTALCISSLEIFGDTQFGRSIKSLCIPLALSTLRIVQEWWKAKKDEEFILLYVAACVNSLPRAVEIVATYLTKHCDRSKDQMFIRDLFVYLREELSDRYAWKTFPERNLLYSIIFAKSVPLDDAVQRFIAHSILFNSVETCRCRVEEIVPISSLTVLAGITSKEKDIKRWTINIYEDTLEEIANMANDGIAEGVPFESFFANWMRYRWLIARAAGKGVTLAELLGIEDEMTLPEAHIFNEVLNVVATASLPREGNFDTLIVSSDEDAAGHLKEVEEIYVDANHPIAVRRGAKDDKFDLLVLIYQGEGKAPLLFYMDFKSASPGNKNSVDIYNDLTKYLPQYEKVKSMCDEAHVPFLYCYLTHHPGSLSMRGNRCLILREQESKHFFGPMWSLYIACRSTF